MMREPVEAVHEAVDNKDPDLDPREFTIDRKHWPSKR
jgi:hypothetical protein